MSSLIDVYGSIIGKDRAKLILPLTDTGSSGGSRDMNTDGSMTPVNFYRELNGLANFSPVLYLSELIILLSGDDTAPFTNYGNVAGPLANGSQTFFIIDGSPSGAPLNFKQSSDFYANSFVNPWEKFTFNTNENIIRWSLDFSDNGNFGAAFYPATNDQAGVTINDDLSGVTFHRAYAVFNYINKNIGLN